MIRVGRRISQVDVARAAGVSTAVVSTVVNGRTDGPIRVSEATRERVLAAVEELGYVPDPAARRLVGARSQVIGVFTYEAVFPLAARSFYHDFLIGIEQAAEEADQDLLLVTSSRRAASQRSLYATGVNGLRLADGGLLFGSSIVEADIRRLASEGYPFVFIGERRLPDVELSFVAADYVGATSALVRRAADLGHERIGFVRQGEDVVTGRYAGFVAGVQERDLPLHVFELRSEGIEQVPAWVRQHDLTCIFMQGRTSLGLVEPVLAEAGIRVPADLSVVSLGGYPDRLADRMVTHLSIPRLEMGREGVRLLMELTDNPARAPRRARMSCEIADGETLVEPPADAIGLRWRRPMRDRGHNGDVTRPAATGPRRRASSIRAGQTKGQAVALKDQIRTDMTKAMKERDKEKLAALRMLMAAIGTAETEGSAHELSDDEVLELVSREVKKRKEAAEAFASGGRDQSAAAELTEAKVLSAYLPAQLSDDEIEQIVAVAVAGVADQTGEKPGMRQMGQVMKAANAQVAGRAEGARVAAAVKSALA